MELFQSKLLLSLIEQQLRQRKDSTQKRSAAANGYKFDAAVDNEFCDIIVALYDNEYNNNNTDSSDNDNISIDDMISIIHNNSINDNNGKTENDLQIQLAMLWRIINISRKSRNSSTIINLFFKNFLENVRSLPPLALSINGGCINKSINNNCNSISNLLPYPELAYLTHSNANSTPNNYDKQKDPLGLIEKIIDSVENFAASVNDDEKNNALSLSLILAIKTGKLSFILRAILLLLSKPNSNCNLNIDVINDIANIYPSLAKMDNSDNITKTYKHNDNHDNQIDSSNNKDNSYNSIIDNNNNDKRNDNNHNDSSSSSSSSGSSGSSNDNMFSLSSELYSDTLQEELSSFAINCLKLQISKRVGKGGLAFSFGKSDQGKLGHGDASLNRQIPTLIETLMDTSIVKVVSMSTHVLAIDDEGLIYIWGGVGLNSNSTIRSNTIPVLLDTVSLKIKVIDISCGLAHSLFLTDKGRVYSKGNGGNGRLGLGDTNDRTEITLINSIVNYTITSITCGACNSLALTDTGLLLIWGKNSQGQCGVGHTEDLILPALNKYLQNKRLIQLAAGWEHSIALTSEGHLYSWGCGYKDNRRGIVPPVLGLGDSEGKTIPEPVISIDNVRLKRIASGWDHCLALDVNGKVLSWGSGQNGKLGHGTEENIAVPCYLSSLENVNIIFIAAGSEHSAAISETGLVYTWGHGDGGRLGHGDNSQCLLPTPSITLGMMNARPFFVHCGDKFTIVTMSPEIQPLTSEPLEGSPITASSPLSSLDQTISNIISQGGSWVNISSNANHTTNIDNYFHKVSNDYIDNFIKATITNASGNSKICCQDLAHTLLNVLSRTPPSPLDSLHHFSVEISFETYRYISLVLGHYSDFDYTGSTGNIDTVLYSILNILEENLNCLIATFEMKISGEITRNSNDKTITDSNIINSNTSDVTDTNGNLNSRNGVNFENTPSDKNINNNSNNNNDDDDDEYQMSGSRLLVNFEEHSDDDDIDDDGDENNVNLDNNDVNNHRNYYLSRDDDDDDKGYVSDVGLNVGVQQRPGGGNSNHDDDQQQSLINFEFRGELIGNRAATRQLPGSRSGSRGANRVVDRIVGDETDLILGDNQEIRDGFDELEDSHDSLEATFDFNQLEVSSPQHLTDFVTTPSVRLHTSDSRRDSPHQDFSTHHSNSNSPTSNLLPVGTNNINNNNNYNLVINNCYDEGLGFTNDTDALDDSVDMSVANLDDNIDTDNSVDVQRAILSSMENLPQIINYKSESLENVVILKETLLKISNKLYCSIASKSTNDTKSMELGLWYKIQRVLKVGFSFFYPSEEKKNVIVDLLLNPERLLHIVPGLVWGLHTHSSIRANIADEDMLLRAITFIQTQLVCDKSSSRNGYMMIMIRRNYYRFVRSVLTASFMTTAHFHGSILTSVLETLVDSILTELDSLGDNITSGNAFLESSLTSIMLPFMTTILSASTSILQTTTNQFFRSSLSLFTKITELYAKTYNETNMAIWLYDKMRFLVLFISRSLDRIGNPIIAFSAVIKASKGIPMLLKYFNDSIKCNVDVKQVKAFNEDIAILDDTITYEINSVTSTNGSEQLYQLIDTYACALTYSSTKPNSNTINSAISKLLEIMASNANISLEGLELIEKCVISLLSISSNTVVSNVSNVSNSNVNTNGINNIIKLLLTLSQQLYLTAGKLHSFNVATKSMDIRVLLPCCKTISATSPTLCTNILTPFGDFMLGFWVHLPDTFDLDATSFSENANTKSGSRRIHLISRISETSDTNLVSLVRGSFSSGSNPNSTYNPNVSLLLEGGLVYIEVAITLIEYTGNNSTFNTGPKKKSNTVFMRSSPLVLGQWHYVIVDLARSEEKNTTTTTCNVESFSARKVAYVEKNIARLYVNGDLHEETEVIGGKSQLYQNIIIGTIPWCLGSADSGLQIADVCWLKTPNSSVSFANTIIDKNIMLQGFNLPSPPSTLISSLDTTLRAVLALMELLSDQFKYTLSAMNSKSSTSSFLAIVPTLCEIVLTIVYNGSEDCQMSALGILSMLLTHTTSALDIDVNTNLPLSPAGNAKNMTVSRKSSSAIKQLIVALREMSLLVITPTENLITMINYNIKVATGSDDDKSSLLPTDSRSIFILRVIQGREDCVGSKSNPSSSSSSINMYSININENAIINRIACFNNISSSDYYDIDETNTYKLTNTSDFITQLILLLSGGGLPVPITTSSYVNIPFRHFRQVSIATCNSLAKVSCISNNSVTVNLSEPRSNPSSRIEVTKDLVIPFDPFKIISINDLPLDKNQRVPSVDELVSILKSIQTNGSSNGSHGNGSMVSIVAFLRFILMQYLNDASKNTSTLTEVIENNIKNIISIATLDISFIIGTGLGININDPNTKGPCADMIRNILKEDDITFFENIFLNFFKEFRYHYHSEKANSNDDSKNDVDIFHLQSQIKVSLAALAGDIHITDTKVRALSHFPSISLQYVSLRYLTGRWFYECNLLSDGLMQIGWAGSQFRCDPVCGQGVGDHLNSWAFDGLRMKKWNVSCEPYGRRWRLGDTVGVLVDMDLLEMRYYLNGEDLGCAFSNFQSTEIFPAFSLNVRQIIRINFGQFKFLYPPDEIDGKAFKPIMEAISRNNDTIKVNSKLYDNDNTNDRADDENNNDSNSDDNRDDEDNDNDDGNDYDVDNEEAAARRLIAMENEWAEGEGQVNDNDENNNNDDNDDNNDTLREIQLHRQSLIEALIGMGFPVDWSLRAAENPEASLSESTAIAWIIEKMEYEQNKIDEMEGDSSRVVEDEDAHMEAASFDYLLRHQESNRTILSNSNLSTSNNINNAKEQDNNALISSNDNENDMTTSKVDGQATKDKDDPDSYNVKRGLDFHNYQDEYSGNVPWITDVIYPPVLTPYFKGLDETKADLLNQLAELDIADFIPILVSVEVALCVYYARAFIISSMNGETNTHVNTKNDLLTMLLKNTNDADIMKLMKMCFKQCIYTNTNNINDKVFPNIMAIHGNHDSSNFNIFWSSRLPIQPFIEPAYNPCLSMLLSKLHLHHYEGSFRTIAIQELTQYNNCMRGLSTLLEAIINTSSNKDIPSGSYGDSNGSSISSDFNEMESKSLRGVGININTNTNYANSSRRILLLLLDETLIILENASSFFNENKDWILFSGTSILEEMDLNIDNNKSNITSGSNTRSTVLWAYFTLKKIIRFCVSNKDDTITAIITPDVLSRLLKLLIFSSMSLKYFIFDLAADILNKLVVRIEYSKHSHSDIGPLLKLVKEFYISIELERNLLQFFGLRLRTEANSRVFSIYTRAIGRVLLHWRVLRVLIDLHHCKHVTKYITSDNANTNSNDETFFKVTQISSNSITVSWSIANDANLYITNVTSTGLENPVLILRRLGPIGVFRIEDLHPDTLYLISISYDKIDSEPSEKENVFDDETQNNSSNCDYNLYVGTEVEPSFVFDAHNISPNLVLNSNHLSLRNISNKKWSTARGTVRMVAGIHSWDVHIDRCISKNIFIGVITEDAKLDNYVGCDKYGWAFLANKAIWHNKSKLKAYGDLFKSGDTVTITLDLDIGILSFSLNGKDLGVAVENLSGPLYPAFSLYNEDDQLSIVPPKTNSKGRSKNHFDSTNTSSSERIIDRLNYLNSLLTYFTHTYNPDNMYDELFKRLKMWEKDVIVTSTLVGNDFISIIIDKTVNFNGFFPGDVVTVDDSRVRQKKDVNNDHGHGIVIGYAHHRMWIQLETTREILGMTSDTIGQLKQKGFLCLVSKSNYDNTSCNTCPWLEAVDDKDNSHSATSIKTILERLSTVWGRDNDILLISLLESIARVRNIHPTHISINDIIDFHKKTDSTKKYVILFNNFSMLDICLRSLAIIMLNDLLFPLLKLVSPLHDTNIITDTDNSNDTSSLVYHLRHLIFKTVKSDYAAFVANNVNSSSSTIFYPYYQYFSKLLNRTYYHHHSNIYSNSSVKTTVFLEDKQKVFKRLMNSDSDDGSIRYQKNKLLTDMQASFVGQFYSHIERFTDSSTNPTSSNNIGFETGLRSVCTNSIFFTHPDATNNNEHVNIIVRKNPDSDDHSYLFQLLDEYEANLNSINIVNMEKLIFDEFMMTAMAQVQEVVSSLFADNSSLLLHMTAVETRAVLYFFYATGLLIGVGIRNGAPMNLHLPSVFYSLIGSIAETKKVASFHSLSTDSDNYNSNMIATCALTMRLGLSSVFPEAALNIFDSNDIQAVLTSTSSILSPYFLQTRAQYDGGLLSTDVHIEIFWNNVRGLSKKRLIAFLKKVWKGHQLPEYTYYESQSENGQLPAPLIIKPPTALGMLTPDNADIVVLTSGSISIPHCTNNKYMMDKLLEFIRN